jgi:enoyl-CoA hydratase/carnithine racemase
VKSDNLETLLDKLAEGGDVDAVLAGLAESPSAETSGEVWQSIDRCFSGDSLEEILASLSSADGAFEASAIETVGRRSPTSLKVAFRQIREGRGRSMADCMNMEFRILNRMLAGHDFYEGIRAVVIDKDNQPAWRPATLEEVSAEAVDAYFAPLGERELGL